MQHPVEPVKHVQTLTVGPFLLLRVSTSSFKGVLIMLITQEEISIYGFFLIKS